MRYFGLICVLALAGCGGPAAEIGRLSEQDLPDDAETLEAVPGAEAQAEAEQGGFLAKLFGGGTEAEAQNAPDLTLADGEAGSAPDVPTEQAATDEGAVETASLTPPETFGATQEVAPKPQRGGLFGLFGGGGGAGKPAADVTSEIELGTVLPYGRVARICGLSAREMGQKVESYPERRATYALYDSAPGSTALRTFYLTGFEDGCARQFSAAMALMASASMHEQLRYGLPAEVQPYSTTDKAYEDLKVQVCKVPRRKPCGERVGRLDKDTVFVSVYERFGSNAQWSNLLVHDGTLLAQDKKGL